ncbi:glycosyltransferase [Arthrospiribacter ruber]|uniref:Glycosyltransferase n=1 Tax=Arthrospiribacter ruber TaxID=2487934 RepID=A0A951IVY9_9BACT|nr:glycosyltransferase [Arthrospiribacter ruber]MBW3466593.1 glycosyltransferase [Arthrospiribacter ruber]
MRILILPSWYPTPKQPIKGSFFQEQAMSLHGRNRIDIRILYGDKKSTGFLQWFRVYIHSWLAPFWVISSENVKQSPLAFGFDLPVNRRIPDKIQVILEKRLYFKAYKMLTRSDWVPDLIHAQSGMDAGIYAHHINNKAKIPFVIIEHQVFVFHYYSRLRAKLVLEAFEEANKTAAVSFDERRQVLMNQTNCNPEIIWNLVDETKYKIQLEKRNKVFTIITILNSLPIKGFDTFLEAMLEFSKKTKEFKFIMIGKGADEKSKDPASNAFFRKSKELGIYDFGDFKPFVKRNQIPDILNTAHVFVSSSIQEPHGIAVREAMMCGLPVVSTANGGVEDSITPETGILVHVKNPKAIAAALLKVKNKELIYDPQKIREVAINQCGREAFSKSMLDFYRLD